MSSPAALSLVPLVEGTGEIVEARRPVNTVVLQAYASAAAKRDLLALKRQDRIREIEADDPVLASIDKQIAEVALFTAEIESTLADAFDPEVRKQVAAPITLDIGCLRVTWGKPAARWVQNVKPAVIAKQDPELAALLGIRQETGEPPAPRITLRLEQIALEEVRS